MRTHELYLPTSKIGDVIFQRVCLFQEGPYWDPRVKKLKNRYEASVYALDHESVFNIVKRFRDTHKWAGLEMEILPQRREVPSWKSLIFTIGHFDDAKLVAKITDLDWYVPHPYDSRKEIVLLRAVLAARYL